jgi:hypothetical protein
VGCWDCEDQEEDRFWSQITSEYIKLLPEDESKRNKVFYRSHRNYPLTTEVPMPRFRTYPLTTEVPMAAEVPMPRLYIARMPDRLET